MALSIMLAGILFANMVPDSPISHLVYAQSADSSIEYAENGTAPVGAFRAYDQDRNAIRWSLSGPDADLFTINGGVLAFKKPPNYEDPKSAAAGVPRAERNVYRVTIEAAGGTHDVAVTVTDVDEAGIASMDRPQPQVDRPLEASLSDEDDAVTAERWQWSRSKDGRTWTNIERATAPRRRPAPGDVGMYLRATVTYSDTFGTGKTASAVTAYQVEPRTLSNAAPSFADQDDDDETAYIDVARSVAENTAEGMNLGTPVSATDDDDDILFYELLDTPDLRDADDAARFTIDRGSGQIRVGKELGADASEREDEDSAALSSAPALPEGEDAGDAGNSEYVLRVKVSDPSTASDTVNVIVTITDVNEAPHFVDEDPPTVLKVTENADPPVITIGNSGTPIVADTYAVTDQDGSVTGPDAYDDTSYTYSVSDRSVFAFNRDGILSFRAGRKPDFEKKSSYSITVVASSGEGSRKLNATLNVTIDVVDAEDVGKVSLSQRQPQVGIDVHAMVNDPDGGVTITSWTWERSTETTVDLCRNVEDLWTPIGGASSAVYTPQPADIGRCLRATVTYTDNIDAGDQQAMGVLEVPVQRGHTAPVTVPGTAPVSDTGFVNAAPVFPDQDFNTEGDQSDRTSREVAENTKAGQNIGMPVSAHDDDGDLLIYTLGGADAASFSISRNSGQLKTRSPLNYEAKNIYTVTVTATDPFGAADSILVTINVTDEDDPPEITVNTGVTGNGPWMDGPRRWK